MKFLKELLFFLLSISLIDCHGWLEEPKARNGRFNEMFCGGFPQQYYYNANRCGICGDNFRGSRNHETSATRKFPVTKTYLSGEIINIRTIINANHLGTVEVKVCPMTNNNVEVTQECLDRNPLEIISSSRSIQNDPYKATVVSTDGDFTIKAKLPDGLVGDHVVLQWKYRSGNSHGVYENGSRVLGIGAQEEFVNCADIQIVKNPNSLQSAYRPKPIETKQSDQIIFTCATYGRPPARSNEPDLFQYTGIGFVCYWLRNLSTIRDERIRDCEFCRVNCISPDTVCPDYCMCRWYGPKRSNANTLLTIKPTISIPTTTALISETVATTTVASLKPDFSQVKSYCSNSEPPPKSERSIQMIFKGSVMICYLSNKFDCDYCKANCLSPEKVCPCECRWY